MARAPHPQEVHAPVWWWRARFRRPASPGDWVFQTIALLAALSLVGLLVAMTLYLLNAAWPAVTRFGLGFLTSSTWDPVQEVFGALPAVYGTLLTSAIAMLVAIPVSLGVAIFLAELAPPWLRAPASFLVEMLAAIPSVVLGLWGLFVMVPVIRDPVERWLGSSLGFLPLFQGPPFGVGFLAGGLILAIMALPIITAVARDTLAAVPSSQREAMLALGATRWEAISRAVLPYARSGIVAAGILGLGRALGETMAVTMVIGNGYQVTARLFAPGNTMASKIATEFNEASGDLYIGSLVELALVLFAITLMVNVVGRLLVRWTVAKARVGGQ
ncbi:MAG: phosphate ABC transporter permease subunit PstC [Chloroflexi bacterium]|nr:phosphate ABC transporter permease subunit PstC [Chloroflexota bacterium]